MEKVKVVKIKDMGRELTFSIRLFGALEGFKHLDATKPMIAGRERPSILKEAEFLLPLATLMDTSGKTPLDTMSLDNIDSFVENPLTIDELLDKIWEHQRPFWEASEKYRGLKELLDALFPARISESQQQSET